MLLASTNVGQDALIRFYVLHVAFLPLIAGTLIGVHFWRIRKDGGLSRPPDKIRPDPYRVVQRSDTKESFAPGVKRTYGLMELVRGTCPTVDKGPYNFVFTWPHLLRAELVAFLFTTVLILGLSFIDAPLEEPANPSKPTNPSKAPWYFLGLQEMVAYNAFWGGVAIPWGLFLGLMSIPYLDRNPHGEGVLVSSQPLFGDLFLHRIYDMARAIDYHRHLFPRGQLGMDLAVDRKFCKALIVKELIACALTCYQNSSHCLWDRRYGHARSLFLSRNVSRISASIRMIMSPLKNFALPIPESLLRFSKQESSRSSLKEKIRGQLA